MFFFFLVLVRRSVGDGGGSVGRRFVGLWCLLLAPDLPFGAVEWWRPRQLVLLRSTCKAFRSGQSHEESLFNVLTAGLGAPEKMWTRITNASALYDLCHRLFEERLLIATL